MSAKALWVPLDVNFLSDPAILACSPEAQLLYVRSLCLAKQTGSNGFIDKKQVAYLCFGLLEQPHDVARPCQDLLDEHLWIDTGTAYEIRSWAKYNKSPEEIEKLSQARREAGRKGGRSKAKQVASTRPSKTKQRESRGREEVEVEKSPTGTSVAVPKSDDAEPLANLLADLIAKNGANRPHVTDAWVTDMDRLLRIDGRAPAEVEQVVRWCQADPFWHSNILSPSKLRKQYDALNLKRRAPVNGGAARQPNNTRESLLALTENFGGRDS